MRRTLRVGIGSAFACVLAVTLAADSRARDQVGPSAGATDGRIAFTSGPTFDLRVVSADGRGRLRLARNSADTIPAWSPDGRRIAFVFTDQVRRDGAVVAQDEEIHVVGADGRGRQRLSRNSDPVSDGSPAWSPDGRRIAFDHGRVLGPFTVQLINPDGSGRRRLARGSAPAWSPDARRILFLREGDVFVVGVDGSGRQRLTRSGRCEAASWSPDGRRIAFASGEHEFGLDVYVMSADGSGQRRLTGGRGYAAGPAWSPDGRKIVFWRGGSVRHRAPGFETAGIYVMNADGSGQRRLTRPLDFDKEPAWSPDGRMVVFVRYYTDSFGDVYVMNADGSGLRRLTRNRFASNPVWSP